MQPRYSKLAALYFFYFASLGIYLPYGAPYLDSLGLTPVEIGELLAIALVTKIFAPYIWGWISDHTAQRLRMMRIAAGLSGISYSMLLLRSDYAWLAVAFFFFGFFLSSLLPQLESITMDSLRHMSHYYSKIRLWGSWGFIVCAMGSAPLVNHFGIQIVPYLTLFVLVMMWLVSFTCVDYQPPVTVKESILPKLKNPKIWCLMIFCFVMQLTHTPYYAFFSIYMRDVGYSETLIGQLWALGVIAEVGIFMIIPKFFSKFQVPSLLGFSILVTALRWALIAQFPQQLSIILFAQTLHAVTFGLYHAAAIHLYNRWFPGNLQGRGQAIYQAVSFGLGGAIGSLIVGHLWAGMDARSVFLIASAVALTGVVLVIPLYRKGI